MTTRPILRLRIQPPREKQSALQFQKAVIKTLGLSYKAETVKKETGKLYRVQVGAYADKANAEAAVKKLKAAGFDAIIVEDVKK